MSYSSGANVIIKNNRSLKKRKGFFKSYKELDYKHNLQEHSPNENIKKMSSYKMNLLKLKLRKQRNSRTLNFVLGISLIILLTLFAVKFF